jgi:NADH:ubiquinone oxidoreductase subunit
MGIFGWWEGATLGTMLGLRKAARIGSDPLGNVYYERGTMPDGRARRSVIYAGSNDASRIPPEWHSWLHHQVDTVPDATTMPRRSWQLPAAMNATGTPAAYRPAGALEQGGRRARATGDYEAWSPDEA